MEQYLEFIIPTSNLPNPTIEQKKIIDSLDTQNVCVDAVAGSGKTTLALHIALKYPKKNILLLTYNARLKTETRERIDDLQISNLEAHSFHAFGYKYYQKGCRNDIYLKQIIKQKKDPILSFKYDLIIVDEAQDMKELFYEFILKLVKDNEKEAKICIMGDKFQTIYQCFGADGRYLTMAPKLFNINNFEWTVLPLHYTWRLTKSITTFVNKVVLQSDRLKTMKVNDQKIEYKILDIYGNNISIYFKKIFTKLFKLGYEDKDIFILAPSTKSTSGRAAVNRIANYLSKTGHSIFIEKKDINTTIGNIKQQSYLDNKILISSFHQSKGLERKVVIIMNFDSSYYKYFAKNEEKEFCTNGMYVALTRHSEKLILIHNRDCDYLPFVDKKVLKDTKFSKYFEINNNKHDTFNDTINKNIRKIGVINLLEKISIHDELYDEIDSYLNISNTEKDKIDLNFNWNVYNKEKKVTENISQIIGITIPIFYNYIKTKKLKSYELIDTNCLKEEEINWYNKLLNLKQESITLKDILKFATIYYSCKIGVRFLLDQINDYNFVNQSQINEAIERLKIRLRRSETQNFEVYKDAFYKSSLLKYHIEGSIDCETENLLWEFKCVKELQDIHKIQCAIYMWLYKEKEGKVLPCKLFNIETNETLLIKSTSSKLDKFMSIIIEFYEKEVITKISDKEFLNKNKLILEKYDFNLTSEKKSCCNGYPLSIFENMPKITNDIKKEWKLLSDKEMANIEYWFEKDKTEDPITKKKIIKNSDMWHTLNNKYSKWESKIKRNNIKANYEEYNDIIKHIDKNKDKVIFFRNYCFKRPTICGFLKENSLICGTCGTKIEDYDITNDSIECEECDVSYTEESIQWKDFNNKKHLVIKNDREFRIIK